MKHTHIGLGSQTSTINFYIANRPPIDDYPVMNELRGLAMGELTHIVKHTSNHWRKAFNVYAKEKIKRYLNTFYNKNKQIKKHLLPKY